jgi:tyrosyl-tRNA synthetase
MKMAFEITSIFYGETEAAAAQEAFIAMFQKKEAPQAMPEYRLQEGQTILDVMLAAEMASSRSEARRLIDQKGVRLDGEVLERGDAPFPHAGILQVGKRKFLRVIK